jgi:hypothetical protein
VIANGTVTVDAARLRGVGDIHTSYSADRIAESKPIRRPFSWRGGLWVCTGSFGEQWHEAYRMVAEKASTAPPRKYGDDHDRARKDPNGFYHGITVKHGGAAYVLIGPAVRFVGGEKEQGSLFE